MLERQVEREVRPYYRAHGVGFIPCYPLAGGFLSGKYKRGQPPLAGSHSARDAGMHRYMTDAYYATMEALMAWAAARGRGLNELAQAWLLAQPQVCSVISGAIRLEHVLHNTKAMSWSLSHAELAEVNALLEQGRSEP
jgi:aryl-alcohol dehydrogenase-like predicted oxidoreductase